MDREKLEGIKEEKIRDPFAEDDQSWKEVWKKGYPDKKFDYGEKEQKNI